MAGISTNYTEVTWSGADTKGKSIIESSTNLTLSLSFHGIGAAAGKTFKRGRHERDAYENHEINFLTSIMDAKKNQILLYCPSRLQAWLVSKVSVLLHLVLTWMAYMAKGDASLWMTLRRTPSGIIEPRLEGGLGMLVELIAEKTRREISRDRRSSRYMRDIWL